MYIYDATLLKVVDGDTIHARIHLGLDVTVEQTLRLRGVDTPELRSPDDTVRAKAQEAKVFTATYLPTSERGLIVQTYKDRREKYGRYLAVVFSAEDFAGSAPARSLNDALVDAGLAKSYKP